MSDNEATIDFTELNRQNADKRKGNAKNSPNKYRKVAPNIDEIKRQRKKLYRRKYKKIYYQMHKEELKQKQRDMYGFNPREVLTDEERQRRVRESKKAYWKRIEENDKEIRKKPYHELTSEERNRLQYIADKQRRTYERRKNREAQINRD